MTLECWFRRARHDAVASWDTFAHGTFSHDGQIVATTAHDQTARIWDVSTGQQITPPLKHDATVNHTSFSPDTLWLITASMDRTARIWNTGTGELAAPLLRHAGAVNTAAFSHDGKYVLTASADHSVRVWESPTSHPTSRILEHLERVNCVVYSPDGIRVATGSDDKTVRVWDAQTGQPLSPQLQQSRRYSTWHFLPTVVVWQSRATMASPGLWDLLTNKPIADYLRSSLPVTYAGGERDFIAFDRAGTRVVVTRGSQGVDVDLAVPTRKGHGQFRVWNTATGQPVTPEITLPRAVNSASFGPTALACCGKRRKMGTRDDHDVGSAAPRRSSLIPRQDLRRFRFGIVGMENAC